MKIWTWNWASPEKKSMNAKWGGGGGAGLMPSRLDRHDALFHRNESFLPRLAFHITSEADGGCCRGGGHNALPPLYPFQASSPTLTLLNPDGSPVLGRSLQASLCQGSQCSPHAGTEACALKLSPPSAAASAGGYLPPRRPHRPTVAVWSLIKPSDFCFPTR